jgi:hypothetical protein
VANVGSRGDRALTFAVQQTTLVGAADEQATPSPYANMTAEELRARLRAFLPDEPVA